MKIMEPALLLVLCLLAVPSIHAASYNWTTCPGQSYTSIELAPTFEVSPDALLAGTTGRVTYSGHLSPLLDAENVKAGASLVKDITVAVPDTAFEYFCTDTSSCPLLVDFIITQQFSIPHGHKGNFMLRVEMKDGKTNKILACSYINVAVAA